MAIHNINNKLLAIIFTFVDLQDSLSLQLTCKKFHRIIFADQTIWKSWCIAKIPKCYNDIDDYDSLPHIFNWNWLANCLRYNVTTEKLFANNYSGFGYRIFDAFTYAGQWHKSEQDGFGVCVYSKYRFIGYKKGYIRQGFVIYENKDTFKGQLVGYTKHGYGIYTWSDGGSYSGEWKLDDYHGYGIFKWPDNTSYQGMWNNDKYHGYGTFAWPNGDAYFGEWIDGFPVDILSKRAVGALDTNKSMHPSIQNAIDKGICTRSVPGQHCNLGQIYYQCNQCNIRACVVCRDKCHANHAATKIWSSQNNCGCIHRSCR